MQNMNYSAFLQQKRWMTNDEPTAYRLFLRTSLNTEQSLRMHLALAFNFDNM